MLIILSSLVLSINARSDTLKRLLGVEIECTSLEASVVDYKWCNDNCYNGNPKCYYGTGEPVNNEICYCYDESKPVPTNEPTDIECTALEGGDYKWCNDNCYDGLSECYYGTGEATDGEICYCYDESKSSTADLGVMPQINGGDMKPTKPTNGGKYHVKSRSDPSFLGLTRKVDTKKQVWKFEKIVGGSEDEPHFILSAISKHSKLSLSALPDRLSFDRKESPEKFKLISADYYTYNIVSLYNDAEFNKWSLLCRQNGELTYENNLSINQRKSECQWRFLGHTTTTSTTTTTTTTTTPVKIMCTKLEGGDYTWCNDNCYNGNPKCYYGSGWASHGEICYCYVDDSK